MTSSSTVLCEIDGCGRELHKKSIWKHRRTMHPNSQLTLTKQSVPELCRCAEDTCTFSCRRICDLRKHLSTVHRIATETEERYFPTTDAFSLWKEDYETLNTCGFVKPRGTKDGSVYYTCNMSRSGRNKTRGTGKRNRISKKMGTRCTAGIHTKPYGTGLYMKLYKTHYGHDVDLQAGKWTVTSSEYREIAMKLAQGEKLQHIIGDLNKVTKMPRKKAQARRHEVAAAHIEEEEEDDVVEQEQVQNDVASQEVMDLTESSDDEIQEVAKVIPESRGLKRPADGSANQNASKVVKLNSAPTAMNPRPAGHSVNSSNMAGSPGVKPVTLNSQHRSYNLAIQAAYLEAQRVARQRQESIKNFLSTSSAPSNQGQARSLMSTGNPHVFDLSKQQANSGGMASAYYSQQQARPIAPRPVTQTVDLTKDTLSTGSDSRKGSVRNNSNGNGSKLVQEFETGYKCMRCLELYPTKADLKYHIIKVHSDMLNYKCGKCDQVFSKQSKLEKHERKHGRDKLYVCVKCDSSFYQLENLKRHEKVHEEKKQYKCSGCTRVYTEMEKLVLHERIHKKNELPFQCEVENCGEGFHARGNLKMHMRLVHTKKGKKK